MNNLKTECQHCGGHLEFDDDSSGLDAACPHCGLTTRLVSGIHRQGHPASPNAPVALVDAKARRTAAVQKIGKALIILLLCVAAPVAILYIADQLPGQTGSDLVMAIPVAIGVLIIAVLWIGFPVFVYVYMRRMIALLESIDKRLKRFQ